MWCSPKHATFQSATPQVEDIQLVSFLRFCTEQTLHLLDAVHFFLSLGGTWTALCSLSPPHRRSAASFLAAIHMVVTVSVLFRLRLVIHHLRYLSCRLSLLAFIFWTQSSMKSLKTQPLPFWFWCVVYFLNNIELFRAAMCSKTTQTAFSISRISCSMGSSAKFGLPSPRRTQIYYCLLLFLASSLILLFSHHKCRCVYCWNKLYMICQYTHLHVT